MTSETQSQKPLVVAVILLIIAAAEMYVWISGASGWD